jgi:hypothetical protein
VSDAPEPLRVWAVRRVGNGRIVTAPAFNPELARMYVLRNPRPRRYEVVYADLIPTDWAPEETPDARLARILKEQHHG